MISRSPWQTNTYTYGDSNWGDLLTAYNSEAITYDTIGNPLTYRDGITMTWQNGRELATLTKGNKTLNFTYDPNGLRTKKTVATTSGSTTTTTNVEYVYENGLLMRMTYGNYVLDFSYDANGTPVAFHVDNGGTVDKYYYYGINSRGDVEALYNADGTLHARYEYDAYGKLIATTQPDGTNITATYAIAVLNPLRYRGYVYDNETGLYYLQSRYYDPETCRFINADGYVSTGQGLTGYNMFAYCNNNPVMYSDSTGTRIFECCPYGDCPYCKAKKKSTPESGICNTVPLNDDVSENVVEKNIYQKIDDTVGSILNNAKIDLGIGYGLGGSINLNEYTNVDLKMNSDLIHVKFSPSGCDIGMSNNASAGVTFFGYYQLQFSESEYYSSITNESYFSQGGFDEFVLIDVGGYTIIGASFAVSWDLQNLRKELCDIWR